MGIGRRGLRPLFGVVVFSIGLWGSGAQASGPLAYAVRATLEQHPEIQTARAEVAVAEGEVGLARNGYLPSLNASAGPAGSGVAYEVTLSQTVQDWGTTRSQVEEKRAQLALSQARLAVTQDDAALELIEVYLDVASHRVVLGLIQDHEQSLSELDAMAQARLTGRYGDLGEAGRIALALARVRGQSRQLEGELSEAENHFEHLSGTPPNGVRVPDMPQYLLQASDEAVLTDLIAASPLYRRAALGIRAAEASLKGAQASRYPRLALEGSVLRREIGGRLVNDTSLNLRLRSSSLQGLSFWQAPELARHRRDAAARSADGVRRDLERMVASLRLADRALEGRIETLSDQVSGADQVRSVYREQFLVGQREIQDLVAIESEHYEAERQIIELTLERLRLQYRVAAQLGLLAKGFIDPDDAEGLQP